MGTTSKGYPYPEGTDLVVDGDDAIQALAQAINAKLPYAMATGTRNMSNIDSGETKAFTITFPANRFSAVPTVTMGPRTALPSGIEPGYGSATATGFTLYLYNGKSGNVGTMNVSWHAVQFDAGAALFDAPRDEDEPDATATCTTPGCSNQGIAIPIVSTWTDEDGTTQPVDGVYCGVCNAEITASLQATS